MADRHGHNRQTKNAKSWDVKESQIKEDTAPQERVDLDPYKFERLVQQKGVDVKVFRTTYCPKVKSVDGAEHEIDCNLCNGSGWVDLDPICVKAFMQSQELEKMHNMEGFVDGNQVLMTFPIGVELQYFTKVELQDFTDIYMQRVLRHEGTDTDVLKYDACRVNLVMDYNGVRYYQDQDFKIDQNGNIEWLAAGNKPADNLPYSVHYEAAVQFRATRAMHVNRFSQYKVAGGVEHLKFNEQWLMTKEFLVKRLDENGNELEQAPYDNHTIVDEG